MVEDPARKGEELSGSGVNPYSCTVEAAILEVFIQLVET